MEVTQPFKEAWYHDFAPPIHSLDRHGDFAPPLLALGLAAGFFGVGTGGNGLQYHSAQVYGPHNIGDWLFVEATSAFSPDFQDARVQGGDPAMLLKADSHNGAGSGIILWSHDDVISDDPVWQLWPGGIIYFLDGQDDIGHTEGGDVIRYAGGGSILLYTTDGAFVGSGNFQVITNQSLDDSAITTGSITLNASNSVGQAGNFEANAGGDTPGYVFLSTAPQGSSPNAGEVGVALDVTGLFRVMDHTILVDRFTVAEDSTTVHNLANGKTLVVNDHLGSPLVTYTG